MIPRFWILRDFVVLELFVFDVLFYLNVKNCKKLAPVDKINIIFTIEDHRLKIEVHQWGITVINAIDCNTIMNETQEQHCLLFEYHHHTLCENIIRYLNNEVLANVTLVCCEEKIRAHQIVLSACSPFFENILTTQNYSNAYVVLNDITKNVMQILLEYMYAGQVNVPNALVSDVFKAAKILKLRGLNYEEFDKLQSTFRDDKLDVSNETPNLSTILNGSNGPNGAESPGKNDPPPVVPETNNGVWLTASHKSDKPKGQSKKVFNPFAKKISSSSGSDSTVFDAEKTVPGPSRKASIENATSPMAHDSDIEFIDINPMVVIPDTQCPDDTELHAIEKKYKTIRHSTELSDSDDSEIVPVGRKKPKTERMDDSRVAQKVVKVNPVALKNRSFNSGNSSPKKTSKYFPTSGNQADEDRSRKRNDKKDNLDKEKSNRRACDKSDKDQNKDVSVPSTSKGQSNQPKLNRVTKEPFEGFGQMSVRNLRKFCVVCEKEFKNIRYHIKTKHCVPPRGKKFICEVCSKKFSFESSLTYHNCKK